MNSAHTPTIRHTYTVPGKVLLLGEHIALHHCSAAGFPTQESLSIEFLGTWTHSKTQHTDYPLLIQSKQHPIPESFMHHIHAVCTQQQLPIPQGTVYIDSTIPLGRGFGSSAALSVALSHLILHNTIYQDTDQHVLKHDIWCLAHRLEQFFHGRASGIDTAICTYETPIILRSTTGGNRDEPPFAVQEITIPLLIGYASVPRHTNCASLIQRAAIMLAHPKYRMPLTQATHDAIALLMKLHAFYADTPTQSPLPMAKLIQALHNTINTIHTLLCALHISTTELNNRINKAIAHGAQSGKLSGGGGGGAFVYLCDTQDDYAAVQSAMQQMP